MYFMLMVDIKIAISFSRMLIIIKVWVVCKVFGGKDLGYVKIMFGVVIV